MEAEWFYLDGAERRGPVATEELLRALISAPDPRRVRVWHQGLSEWQEAGTVPEINGKLPPPRPSSQASPLGPDFFATAEAIARLYRRLVLLVGLQLGVSILRIPIAMAPLPGAPLLALVMAVVLVGTLIAMAVTAYQLTSRFPEGPPIVWAIVMFIPCVNIIGLLVLSYKAQAWCQRYGIKVGFLGPTLESIEELRRRVQTSPFE